MTLTDDEKILLRIILDEAERAVTRERESYLRSADAESKFDTINGLTMQLKLISKLQTYCQGGIVA